MQFVDRALAVRLEAAEDIGQIHYAQALAQTRPESGIAIATVAGGHVVFAGKDSSIGRAIGCGLSEPLSAAGLDFIEDFYFSRDADARIDVAPLADDGVFPLLDERGYRLEELNNVLARKLAPDERFNENVAGVDIRAASAADAAGCAAVLAECFSATNIAPLLAPMFRAAALSSAGVALMAEVEGQLVATGNATVSPEHSMVALHGAGTLPEFRGRGIQAALLGRRLNRAVEAGCTLAVIVTRAGTTSTRNAERLGFTLAYTKAVVKKRSAG
jgi:GNAT superfamily N-acetyltransferase